MTTYIQYCNENEGRKFPFADAASLVSVAGLQLPNNIIVDLNITIPSTLTGVYCPLINITPNVISISLASSTLGLLVGSFPRATLVPYASYALSPVIDDVSGWVSFGTGVTQNSFYKFTDATQSGIAPKCINYIDVLPVKRFIKLGSSLDAYVSDIVKLKARGDLVISKHETDPSIIVMELKNPDRFVGPCNKLTDIKVDAMQPNVSLHSINNVTPDNDGIIIFEFTA